MKLKLLMLLSVVLTFLSCSKEEKKSIFDENPTEVSNDNNETSNEGNDINSPFVLEIDFNLKNDDEFQLFYSEEGNSEYLEEMSIKKAVKAGENQKVIFEVPVNPLSLRLDFGSFPQNEIEINNLILRNKEQTLRIADSGLLDTYFAIHKLVKIGEMEYAFEKITEEHYDPFIYASDSLIKKLKTDLK